MIVFLFYRWIAGPFGEKSRFSILLRNGGVRRGKWMLRD